MVHTEMMCTSTKAGDSVVLAEKRLLLSQSMLDVIVIEAWRRHHMGCCPRRRKSRKCLRCRNFSRQMPNGEGMPISLQMVITNRLYQTHTAQIAILICRLVPDRHLLRQEAGQIHLPGTHIRRRPRKGVRRQCIVMKRLDHQSRLVVEIEDTLRHRITNLQCLYQRCTLLDRPLHIHLLRNSTPHHTADTLGLHPLRRSSSTNHLMKRHGLLHPITIRRGMRSLEKRRRRNSGVWLGEKRRTRIINTKREIEITSPDPRGTREDLALKLGEMGKVPVMGRRDIIHIIRKVTPIRCRVGGCKCPRLATTTDTRRV
jgi:hypothetical protein